MEGDLPRSKLLCGPSSPSTVGVGSTALLRKRHSRPHRQLLGAHAAELHDGEEEKNKQQKRERNPQSRPASPFPSHARFSNDANVGAEGGEASAPVPAPAIPIASRPAGLQRHKTQGGHAVTQTRAREARELFHCANLEVQAVHLAGRRNARRIAALQQSTFRAQVHESCGQDDVRGQPDHTSYTRKKTEACGVTPTGARCRLTPAVSTQECDHTHSTGQRAGGGGGSDSQRERRELGVTPGPTTQQDTAKRGRKRGQSNKKEERENEEKEKEREEQQSRHQPTHTHSQKQKPRDKRGHS